MGDPDLAQVRARIARLRDLFDGPVDDPRWWGVRRGIELAVAEIDSMDPVLNAARIIRAAKLSVDTEIIRCIKQVRAETGLGLADAKHLVDAVKARGLT